MRSISCLVLAFCLPGLVAADSFVNWENPHVHPLAMTPDGTKLLAVNTADNRLEVFDLTGGGAPQRTRAVPVGLDPVSVRVRSNTEAWVVNHISDSISIVDLPTRTVVRTLKTLDEPCDVVFAGSPQRAFVTCSQPNVVQVFNPADLDAPPMSIPIQGEDPRSMAVSPDGSRVYVGIFESGNRSTILGGGIDPSIGAVGFPPNVVSDPAGPWGGVNPPPNSGASFDPPIAAGTTPLKVGLIVKQDSRGRWMDDNGGDWTDLVSGPNAHKSGRPEGWRLVDHDIAVIDANTLSVSYVTSLMNLVMAVTVNPATGEVVAVGTDGLNEVRFEPVVNGRFLRVQVAHVDPASPETPQVGDLNPHLDYSTSSVPPAERVKSIGDPRGVVYNAAGTRGYVSGMGSNNVVVIDAAGQRSGLSDTIPVGEGPTGLALDEARQRLYVLNKFAATISVVDTASEQVVATAAMYDPSPQAIKVGRRHLYDTHLTSGTGVVSCASCHVDARLDRLAWDLGDPAGGFKSVAGQNLGAGINFLKPGIGVPAFLDFHPMKGPMTTQTLQDIIGHEPHHWRGDRNGIEEFNPAFVGLLGADAELTPAEMQEFEDFLATITYPPNPFRNFDNSLPTALALPGHYTTGDFGPAGQPLPVGNAVAGMNLYRSTTVRLDAGVFACVTCHALPTGMGTNSTFTGGQFVPLPQGPNGEFHHQLVSVDGSTNRVFKTPQLRNLYEKVGFELTQTENTAGFGFLHDGSIDSLARFVAEPAFITSSDQQVADLVAFLLSLSGSDLPAGTLNNQLIPPGTASKDTHAAVGAQMTVRTSPPPAEQSQLLVSMLTLADAGKVGLVVKGRIAGENRGYAYLGGGVFQSDRQAQTATLADLFNGAGPGSERTFTVVPFGSQTRIGIDRDEDGYFDRDELDACSDPADPASIPGGGGIAGDLDGNGVVDQVDLGIFLADFGCTAGVGRCVGDLDGDGVVDQVDLGIFLANFGSACPQ